MDGNGNLATEIVIGQHLVRQRTSNHIRDRAISNRAAFELGNNRKAGRSLRNISNVDLDININVPNRVLAVGIVKREHQFAFVPKYFNIDMDRRVKLF
jgi:hypothetical protein